MTTPSHAIAQALSTSTIDAERSPLHAARAATETKAQAEMIEALLARLGITPEEALARVQKAGA